MTALGICLVLAAGGAAPVFVKAQHFTLAWTHSIEKTRWEEDYAVIAEDAGPPRLQATAARIRGSGAGMEPPPGAVLHQGWYHYRPQHPWPDALRLTRSGYVPDYSLCRPGAGCQPLSHWLPSDGTVTLLGACRAGPT